MPYIGKAAVSGIRKRFTFLASAGATSISGADANGQTLTFDDGTLVDVFLNGVKLKTGEDYNTSTANTISGLASLNLNDEVEILAYDTFSSADTVSKRDGGTFDNAISVTGNITSTGNLIINDGGNIGSTSDTDAISIASTGDVTLTQDLKIKDGGTIGSASDADAISIASTGDVTLTQNLKVKDGGTIGSASDADAITIASDGKVTLAETVTVSKGIKFPATQVASTDANTLDDYEEGTFTPVIRGSTTAGTYELNTSFDDGFYQKVGRVVTVRVVVALAGSITGGGTDNYIISGLPFNYDVSHNAGKGAVACDSVDFDRTASGIVGICVGAASGTDSDFLRILQIEDDASFRTLPISQAAANDFFEFTYTYATTA